MCCGLEMETYQCPSQLLLVRIPFLQPGLKIVSSCFFLLVLTSFHQCLKNSRVCYLCFGGLRLPSSVGRRDVGWTSLQRLHHKSCFLGHLTKRSLLSTSGEVCEEPWMGVNSLYAYHMVSVGSLFSVSAYLAFSNSLTILAGVQY